MGLDHQPVLYSYLKDAPKNGTFYGRQSGQWVEAGLGTTLTENTVLLGDASNEPAEYATGALGRALLDDADAATGRATLGLGTMAVEAAADYLSAANNLSDLLSAATARTNLGLGSMAVEAAADYLAAASNLSDLLNAATARTNLGLGTIATFDDAPSDGTTYGRKDGAWEAASGGSPAGTGTELQYRVDDSTFGAITDSSWNGTTLDLDAALLKVGVGSAAAPSVRVGSEQSGLFRDSATSLGVTVAGVEAFTASADIDADGGWITQHLGTGGICGVKLDDTDGTLALLSDPDFFDGGQVRLHGSTSTTGSSVEFRLGNTLHARVQSSMFTVFGASEPADPPSDEANISYGYGKFGTELSAPSILLNGTALSSMATEDSGDYWQRDATATWTGAHTFDQDVTLGLSGSQAQSVERTRGSDDNTILEIDFPDISTSFGIVDIFRNTNTTGSVEFNIRKGDNTTSRLFRVNKTDTEINVETTIAGTTPSAPSSSQVKIGGGAIKTGGKLTIAGQSAPSDGDSLADVIDFLQAIHT